MRADIENILENASKATELTSLIELWNEIIEILIVNWQKLPAEIYIIVSN